MGFRIYGEKTLKKLARTAKFHITPLDLPVWGLLGHPTSPWRGGVCHCVPQTRYPFIYLYLNYRASLGHATGIARGFRTSGAPGTPRKLDKTRRIGSGLLGRACGARNRCSGLLGAAFGARNRCSRPARSRLWRSKSVLGPARRGLWRSKSSPRRHLEPP